MENQISIKAYSIQNLEPLLDKFKKIFKKQNQNKYQEDDWVQFAVYSLSIIIKDNFYCILKQYSSQLLKEELLQKIKHNKKVSFLMKWLSSVDGYSTYTGKTAKDRKNAFFRILVRHLKKHSRKVPITNSKSEILTQMQQKLNKNTVSNPLINELFQKWNQELNEYIQGNNILRDLLVISKSIGSRYFFILHLDCIRIFAEEDRIGEFQFYEKLKIQKSVEKIVEILFDKQTRNKNVVLIKNQQMGLQKKVLELKQQMSEQNQLQEEVKQNENQKEKQMMQEINNEMYDIEMIDMIDYDHRQEDNHQQLLNLFELEAIKSPMLTNHDQMYLN